jgi:hypothetical protein
MRNNPKDQFSEQETKHRRDAVIKLMLNTPPQHHKPLKSMTPKRSEAQRKKAKAAKRGS